MRRYLIGLTGLFVLLSACKKEDPYLNVVNTPISFEQKGGSVQVAINANDSWVASSSAAWCTVSPQSGTGTGNEVFTIVCPANENYDLRECTISIKSGTLSASIFVSQDENIGLKVSQNSFDLSNDAQTISLDVSANVSYDVIMPSDASWITLASTKGLSNDKLSFNVAKNTEYDSRSCTIIVRSKDKLLEQSIKVSQSQNPCLIISNNEYNVSSDSQSVVVDLKANVNYEVSISESASNWISVVSTKSLQDYQVRLDVKKNESGNARTGEVYINEVGGDLMGTVVISQAGAQLLYVDNDTFSLTHKAQTITINVSSNVEYELVIPDSAAWIKTIETKSVPSKSVQLSISENKGYSDRSETITFKQLNGELSVPVNIIQKQTDCIAVKNSDYSISYVAQSITIDVESNVEYEVSVDDNCKDWISIVNTKALSNSQVTLDIAKNTTDDDRKGQVTIKQANGNISQTISIVQGWTGVVKFADVNFEKYCLQKFDSNEDGGISKEEAQAAKVISCPSLNINSVGELKYFTSLDTLNISNNPIESISLEKNTSLKYINASNTNLKQIDIHTIVALLGLNLYNVTDLREVTVSSLKTMPVILSNGLHSIKDITGSTKNVGSFGYPLIIAGNSDMCIAIALANITQRTIGVVITGMKMPTKSQFEFIIAYKDIYSKMLKDNNLEAFLDVEYTTATKTGKTSRNHQHSSTSGRTTTYITYLLTEYYCYSLSGTLTTKYAECDGPDANCPRTFENHMTGAVAL